MKVLSAKEMARVEALSYSKHGKDQELKFMEAAGQAIANFVLLNLQAELGPKKEIILLCGKGNNAGDAYVAGRYLQEQGFSVTALQVFDSGTVSHLTQANMEKFSWVGGTVIAPDKSLDYALPKKSLIIDGLLGTGFQGTVKAPLLDMICKANNSCNPILAVDVPSGLNANTGDLEANAVIRARWTLALEFPKSGFFLGEAWNYVGQLSVLPFGLQTEIAQQAHPDFSLVLGKNLRKLLPPIKRTRHKYQRGSLAILAGSKGMAGAAMLASYASLRAGAGIVRLLHPEDIRIELSKSLKELLKVSYQAKLNSKLRNELLNIINASKAAVIGPGLSCSKETRLLFKDILPRIECPVVLDADALTLLAEEKCDLPSQTLITPHTGEMARLLGMKKAPPVSLDFLDKCQAFAEEKKVSIVLKGAPTFILRPDKVPFVCIKGDPGMATAGSGDVLAGILGSLLAQGLSLRDAALLGVHLHGLAGEEAAKEKTSYSMIASDIIEKLPAIYGRLSSLSRA